MNLRLEVGFYKRIFLGLVLLALVFFIFPSAAKAQITPIDEDPVDFGNCTPEQFEDFNNPNNPCVKPPTLKLAEIWAIKILYILWGLGGLMFFFGLVAIGGQWLLRGSDKQVLEELKKQATYWAISIPVFFAGVPSISLVLKVFPINTGEACYAELNQPAFQLIFPNSCRTSIPGATPGDIDPATNCPTWCVTPPQPNSDYACFGIDGNNYSCCNKDYHYDGTRCIPD